MDQNYEKTLIDTLSMLVKPLVNDLNVTVNREGDQFRINVNTDRNELLVGHRGENIKAIQHITRVIVHIKYPQDRTHFMIDVGEFKKTREHLINQIIPKIAKNEVIELGNSVVLVGLNGYERKLIHNIVTDVKGIETTSTGEGAERKLMIRPTEDSAGVSTMENAKFIDIDDFNDEIDTDNEQSEE